MSTVTPRASSALSASEPVPCSDVSAAVICAAGLLNALELSGKRIEDVKIVLNGAGAAGIACLELLKSMGARHENCIMADTKGVIYRGRTAGMNQWKSAHAVRTEARTLAEALDNYQDETDEEFPQDPERQLVEVLRSMARAWEGPTARLLRQAKRSEEHV